MLTDDGTLPATPRDPAGTLEPQLVPKGARRLPGSTQGVLALCREMTVREIQGHLKESYQIEIAADVISTVTDAVLAEVQRGSSWAAASARWLRTPRLRGHAA